MITKEQVLQMSKPMEREIVVPLFGAPIKIRLFRHEQIEAMRAESMVAGELNNGKMARLLVLRGCLDPAFTDEEFAELERGNAAVYLSLVNAVVEGNGLSASLQIDARRTFSA